MKGVNIIAFSALSTLSVAVPTTKTLHETGLTSVDTKRGIPDGIVKLAIMVSELRHEKKNAFDPEYNDDSVHIHFRTTAGSECWIDDNIEILPGNKNPGKEREWNVCEKDKTQHFFQDETGEFSLTFTKAGGIDGNHEDGLHHPILRVKGIDNWTPINVQKDADDSERNGRLCKWWVNKDETKGYLCALPKIGGKFGKISNEPIPANNYEGTILRLVVCGGPDPTPEINPGRNDFDLDREKTNLSIPSVGARKADSAREEKYGIFK